MDASACSSSSIHSSSYSFASLFWKISRALKMLKNVCNLFWMFFSQFQEFLIATIFCANISKLIINSITKCCGSLSTKLIELDTDMCSCFSIQVIGSVAFIFLDGTQTDSNSKMTIKMRQNATKLFRIATHFFKKIIKFFGGGCLKISCFMQMSCKCSKQKLIINV